MEKENFTASASNMKNEVDEASASNIEEDKASAPIKGKGIDVGSASNMKNDVAKASASNVKEDKASASDIDEEIDKASASDTSKDDSVINYSDDRESEILQYIWKRLEPESTPQQDRAECCIYRVPKSLRDIKPEAYTPQLISIGPLHHGDRRLVAMEEQKLRYFREFITRNGGDKMYRMDIVRSILENEGYIRRCYPENHWNIESRYLVKMMLLDAVFIIEFLKDSDDRLLKRFDPRMIFCIREDLMLLENQLPFFIIEKIYHKFDLAHRDTGNRSFLDLAFHFVSYFIQEPESKQRIKVRHFTDFLRNCMLNRALKRSFFPASMLKYSAVMLRKAGVKFQVSKDNCLVNIEFENGVLKIPQLVVDDSFECLVGNLMASEQCCKYEASICGYLKFMDQLINTAEDVHLLVEEGIIINCLGDNAAVSNLINNLCQQIYETYSCYDDICRRMNAHYENPWNHRKATLKLVYFSNLWRGTGTVAAAILLILTLIQTITSVKSSF